MTTNGEAKPASPDQISRFQEMVANVLSRRNELFKSLMDPRRDVDAECGHPDSYVPPEAYQKLYDRDAVSARVCEVLCKESWQVVPTVYQTEDPDKATPFEDGWDALGRQLRGEQSWHKEEKGSPVWEHLKRADILSGIGHYGIMLVGLDDGADMATPAPGIVEENSAPRARGKGQDAREMPTPGYNGRYSLTANAVRKAGSNGKATKGTRVLYVRAFPEALAQITRFEANPTSPRFGQPTNYLVTVNDPTDYQTGVGVGTTGTVNVHWSRVIHLADNNGQAGTSEVFAPPRMRPVLNRLLDLVKLLGGSAEMYWRGALPGWALSTHPQLGGDVNVNPESLRDMMEDYQNGLQRWLALMGMSVQSLAPQVVDPTGQIAAQLEAVCIKLGVPVRVFKGSERGELASSQDDAAWNDRLRERQSTYITPRVIVPFVDRMIALGVLPEPEDGYYVLWPDLTSQSRQEKASVALTRTQALTTFMTNGGQLLMTKRDYLTRELDYSEDEAQSILDAVDEEAKKQAASGQPPPGPPPPAPGNAPGAKPPTPAQPEPAGKAAPATPSGANGQEGELDRALAGGNGVGV